ncbi:MAG: hypothetical protein AB7G80_04365 [Dongiaceae bacterium]
MKLSQLIAQYHTINAALNECDVENDPLGHEADVVLQRIATTVPQDADDVAALARLARHIIQEEQDPQGALPLLRNIAAWAQNCQSGGLPRLFAVIQGSQNNTPPTLR